MSNEKKIGEQKQLPNLAKVFKMNLLLAEDKTEDIENIAKALKMILVDFNYSITTVRSWEELEFKLKENLTPKIVIVNYNLPGIKCDKILNEIKDTQPDNKIIIITDKGDKDIAIRIMKEGFDGYASKRYGFDGIAYVVLNVISVKRAEIERKELQKLFKQEVNANETIKEASYSLEEKNKKLERIVQIGKILSSHLTFDNLLVSIVKETSDVLEADRSTLFIYDEEKEELWSKIAEKSTIKEIRFSTQKGIAGYVSKTRQILNIKDVSEHALFNREFDIQTGFHTKNMLCAPLETTGGKLVGVIQVLNKKKTTSFGVDDEDIFRTFASLVAVLIENARLSEENLKKERLAIIGDMASTIVHDLRNPMSTIKGYAQLIATTSPDLIKPTSIIANEIDRLSEMAQELLEFSRGSSNRCEFKEIECAPFFNEIFEFLKGDLTNKSLILDHNIEYRGKININKEKIRRAILNIAKNSIESMGQGGCLCITISESTEKEEIIISLIDTGKGMPDEIRKSIFEPFVTHGKQNGTGLGMSITKKIIDLHNGTIQIESKEGHGTKVTITIPKNEA